MSLPPDDARIAFPLPVIDRIGGGPRAHQLLVLAAQTQFVGLVHVERDPCRPPTYFFPRLDPLAFEVDDRLTCPIHGGGSTGPDAVAEVVAIAIDLANRRDEIVQVTFGRLEHGVGVGTVLAATLLPALPLMTQHPGGHDVLPLDASGADRVLAGLKVTAREIDNRLDVGAATVKVLLHTGEDVGQDFLGVGEVPMPDSLLAIDEFEGGACGCPLERNAGFGGGRGNVGGVTAGQRAGDQQGQVTHRAQFTRSLLRRRDRRI